MLDSPTRERRSAGSPTQAPSQRDRPTERKARAAAPPSPSALRATSFPIGHKRVHELVEPWTVAALQQVTQLVDDHIFQAFRRIKCQPHVDADAARRRLATAPATRHVAIRELARAHPHDRLPRRDKCRHTCGNNLAPLGDFLGLGLRRASHGGIRSLGKMRFDPCRLAPNEVAHLIFAHPRRRRHIHMRPIAGNAQIEVFHALAGKAHLDSVDEERTLICGRVSVRAGSPDGTVAPVTLGTGDRPLSGAPCRRKRTHLQSQVRCVACAQGPIGWSTARCDP